MVLKLFSIESFKSMYTFAALNVVFPLLISRINVSLSESCVSSNGSTFLMGIINAALLFPFHMCKLCKLV